jgi:hypothetical protein
MPYSQPRGEFHGREETLSVSAFVEAHPDAPNASTARPRTTSNDLKQRFM